MGDYEYTSKDFNQKYLMNGLSSLPGGFFVYRATGEEEILYANKAFLDLFECQDAEEFRLLTGGTFRGLVHPEDVDVVENSIASQVDGNRDRFDHVFYRIITKSGKEKYIEDFGHLVEDEEDGLIFYVFVVDTRTKYYAFDIDELTGLPGRRRFLDFSERILEISRNANGEKSVSFIYFNLTNFKPYNRKFGISEGDNFLNQFTEILKHEFTEDFVSRFSEDHFVVCCSTGDLEEKLRQIYLNFMESERSNTVGLKMGIYHVTDPLITPAEACDLAKYACDYIKDDINQFCFTYHQGIEREYELESALLQKFEDAIEQDYIKVFFQPVVRTLTGEVCGMEALSRWIDPELGFIAPGKFVPLLEKKNLIHRLDLYVVRVLCRMMRSALDEGQNVVPVSFNLSRLDFILCDPFAEVEKIAHQYEIPRELLRVEITESVFMEDTQKIKEVTDSFHEAGYQVWMDDFGSGYSSLNLLKDFNFDEIKIDMVFISSFTERAKNIVKHTVQMAKSIGIKTLAEGVETEEQFLFLRDIGCEMIQGFYFGKPAPLEDVMFRSDLRFEESKNRLYYSTIAKVFIDTARPYCLLEDDGDDFKIFYMNQKYLSLLHSMNFSTIAECEQELNRKDNPIHKMYRRFVQQADMTGVESTITYDDHGKTLRLELIRVAKLGNRKMYRLILEDLNIVTTAERNHLAEAYLKTQGYLHDAAYILHLDEDYFEEMMRYGTINTLTARAYDLESIRRRYCMEKVFMEDQERYLAFTNPRDMVKRVKASKDGYIREHVRLLDENGNYTWKIFLITLLPDSDDRLAVQYILHGEERMTGSEVSDLNAYKAALWDTMIRYADMKYFWKDTNRKFMGASKAFVDYYDMESFSEIAGLDDTEVGWNIDGVEDHDAEEWDVIEHGKAYRNIHLQNVINGKSHEIIANKFPVYQNGKIVGLLGYFQDAEDIADMKPIFRDAVVKDSVTGLLNSHYLYDCGLKLTENYQLKKEDFGIICVDVMNFEQIYGIYGRSVGNNLLRICSEIIRRYMSIFTVAGRLSGGKFVIYIKSSDQNYILERYRDIYRDFQEITEVDGFSCHLIIGAAVVFASEGDDYDSITELLEKRLLEQNSKKCTADRLLKEKKFFASTTSSREHEMQILSDVPVAFAIYRIVLNNEGTKAVDAQYVLVNQRYCELVGYSAAELIGNSFLKTIENSDQTWLTYCYNCLTEQKEFKERFYSQEIGHWVDFTIAPSAIPGCVSYTFVMVDEEQAKDVMNARQMRTDDIIIRITKSMQTSDRFEVMMDRVLEEMSHVIHPDRIFVMECEGDYISLTYEWCADGVDEARDVIHQLERKQYAEWAKLRDQEDSHIIHVIREDGRLSKDSKIYQVMLHSGVERTIAMPLLDNGTVLGYIGVDNYMVSEAIDIRRILETLAMFLSSKLASHQMFLSLSHVNRHDSLTGAYNRNAYYERLQDMVKSRKNIGVIFADINGLKQINDTRGHDEGDRIIKRAANLLMDVYGEENVFRTGGDELVILLTDVSKRRFDELEDHLRKVLALHHDVSIAIGMEWSEATTNVEAVVNTADENMYAEKAEYYKMHDRRHR